jgi:hypothetical protein
VRSDLVRAGGVRAARQRHTVDAVPLLEFLRAELEKAKPSKTPDAYGKSTQMYLDLIGTICDIDNPVVASDMMNVTLGI